MPPGASLIRGAAHGERQAGLPGGVGRPRPDAAAALGDPVTPPVSLIGGLPVADTRQGGTTGTEQAQPAGVVATLDRQDRGLGEVRHEGRFVGGGRLERAAQVS